MKINFHPLGDTGIQVLFGSDISEETNQQIRMFADYLKKYKVEGITELVPAYTTLTVFYRPDKISYSDLCNTLKNIKKGLQKEEVPSSATVYEIPVLYGGDVGPDLSEVASYNDMTEDEVVSIHSNQPYLIYMMGFVPGFPYLGGMPQEIATPRRENPRAKIETGSVGIAGEQTGVYPLETPGGWQIIGRTPVKLYNPEKEEPILLSAGAYIRFVPVGQKEYDEIEEAVSRGEYKVKSYAKGGAHDEDR
ncbi:5-oxoprolinase subunit PxpB [Sutcliffiella horikoshii]|uniref:5-oxoprolinase subunit PxpB n=1 Tax=Sutcliffiella horikoshii TaxID=79883 RepID=A0A5D4T2H9_9BACI|nr:5-oxoprolinase subunit PxpB [Sutcliffiella horikoshii]TYS69479.1 5-oxoprolinase subunit PxpB [Sutcliffiella horikoshii]